MTSAFKMVRFFTQPWPKSPLGCFVPEQKAYTRKGLLLQQTKSIAKGPGPKGPSKEEQIEKVKMPGFVHPENTNEEGYFTQKAKLQIEELKKKLDKPTIENSEKKE